MRCADMLPHPTQPQCNSSLDLPLLPDATRLISSFLFSFIRTCHPESKSIIKKQQHKLHRAPGALRLRRAMAFLLKAMGFGDTVPGFPFTADADAVAVALGTTLVPWIVKPGKGDEDSNPVAIFSVSLASCPSAEAKGLARNAMILSKRLRLPGVLRCYGGVEYDDTVYVAAEPCVPLSAVLSSQALCREYYGGDGKHRQPNHDDDDDDDDGDHHVDDAASSKKLYEEGVAMGLKSIGGALSALHQHDMFHGNVCADSVFVTAGGFWRLWGLELACPCAAAASGYCGPAAQLLPPGRAPRPLVDGLLGQQGNPRMLDSFGLACLIYETLVLAGPSNTNSSGGGGFDGRRNCQPQDVRLAKATLPPSLRASFDALTDPSPPRQTTVPQFMSACGFVNDSAYVRSLEELEELALLDQTRRDRYMDRLATEIPLFPRKACVAVFLGKLMDSVRVGTASASVVAPVMAIAQRVPDDAEFATAVVPALVLLFSSPDRSLRHRLLQSSAVYGGRVPARALNEQIWPLFAKGFTSPAANIREGTARALVHLAPRLMAHVMTSDVPRLLQALQQDPDGTIRANATICLCLVADYIPEGPNSQRARILVVGFGRMLKDQFFPSRLAALHSMSAVLARVPAKIVADMVLPGVAPLAMDPVAEARQAALSILAKCLATLEACSKSVGDSVGGCGIASEGPVAAAAAAAAPAAASGGWGVFGGWASSPPATPAPATAAPSPAASSQVHSSSVRSVNAHAVAAAVVVAPTIGRGGNERLHSDPTRTLAAPSPAARLVPASRPAPLPVTNPVVAAAGTNVNSGWSDDDNDGDGDDGWGAAPSTTAATPTPTTAVRAPHARSATTATSGGGTLPAPRAGMSLAGGDTHKVRRKPAGGLGASRVD